MFIKDNIKNILPIKNLDNLYIVADFDRTITDGSSKTSWSVLADRNFMPESYIAERDELFNIYRPIEIDTSLPYDYRVKMMEEWFQKHTELFVKYRVKKDTFETAASNIKAMKMRDGAIEFLKFLNDNNIPLLIISAGIGNFIDAFLKLNNCYFDNIHVISNKVIFENNIAIGIGDHIIHSLNKNEISLPNDIKDILKNRNQVLLLGDQISDLNMVDRNLHNSVISIAFLADDSTSELESLKESYDIVFTPGENYHTLDKLLFK